MGRLTRERGEDAGFLERRQLQDDHGAMFDAPAVDKKIVNAGFVVRLKDGRR